MWAADNKHRAGLVMASLSRFRRIALNHDVTYEDAPACERHDERVPMQLRTMHSDSSRPDVVVGLFECPDCGHERREPIRTSEPAA